MRGLSSGSRRTQVIDHRQPFLRPTASVLMVCTEIEPTTVSPLTTTRCSSLGGQPARGYGCEAASLQPVLLRQLREAARAGAEDRTEHPTSWGVGPHGLRNRQRGADRQLSDICPIAVATLRLECRSV